LQLCIDQENLLSEFGIDLEADKLSLAGMQRVLKMTKANLELMFDEWKLVLLSLELAEEKTEASSADTVKLTLNNILASHTLFKTGELVFHIDNLRRVVNVDETCLSLKGLGAGKGGCPFLSFHDPSLPRAGKAVSKCGSSATLMIGGNVAGEATPPHFQFPSTAQEKNQIFHLPSVEFGHNIGGVFGHSKSKSFSPMHGMNEKEGMDEAHFETHLIDLIYLPHLDVVDCKGKRVVVKADQGPGQSNVALLARLCA